MTIRLSIAIMQHPARAAWVAALHAQIPAPFTAVDIVDTDSAGTWPTARRAWLAHDPAATHHLVLQDDVILCRDALPAVLAALAAVPDQAISLYANRAVMGQAVARGDAWVRIRGTVSGQALILPTADIAPWLAWVDQHVDPVMRPDDTRLGMWLVAQRRYTWCTVPSLVQHRNTDGLRGNPPSTNGLPRVARWYQGDASALGIDWTAGRDHPLTDAAYDRAYYRRYQR